MNFIDKNICNIRSSSIIFLRMGSFPFPIRFFRAHSFIFRYITVYILNYTYTCTLWESLAIVWNKVIMLEREKEEDIVFCCYLHGKNLKKMKQMYMLNVFADMWWYEIFENSVCHPFCDKWKIKKSLKCVRDHSRDKKNKRDREINFVREREEAGLFGRVWMSAAVFRV